MQKAPLQKWLPFSDKCNFFFFGFARKQNCWVWGLERPNSIYQVPNNSHFVIVWCSVSSRKYLAFTFLTREMWPEKLTDFFCNIMHSPNFNVTQKSRFFSRMMFLPTMPCLYVRNLTKGSQTVEWGGLVQFYG